MNFLLAHLRLRLLLLQLLCHSLLLFAHPRRRVVHLALQGLDPSLDVVATTQLDVDRVDELQKPLRHRLRAQSHGAELPHHALRLRRLERAMPLLRCEKLRNHVALLGHLVLTRRQPRGEIRILRHHVLQLLVERGYLPLRRLVAVVQPHSLRLRSLEFCRDFSVRILELSDVRLELLHMLLLVRNLACLHHDRLLVLADGDLALVNHAILHVDGLDEFVNLLLLLRRLLSQSLVFPLELRVLRHESGVRLLERVVLRLHNLIVRNLRRHRCILLL